MKNLNEPHRMPGDTRPNDVTTEKPHTQYDGEVISLEAHRAGRMKGGHSLIAGHELEDLRARWTGIQASFVDEPRKAVQDADELVSTAIQYLSDAFRDQRSQLEDQWSSGSDVSTEDLRLSLQNYRTFFERLLSI